MSQESDISNISVSIWRDLYPAINYLMVRHPTGALKIKLHGDSPFDKPFLNGFLSLEGAVEIIKFLNEAIDAERTRLKWRNNSL